MVRVARAARLTFESCSYSVRQGGGVYGCAGSVGFVSEVCLIVVALVHRLVRHLLFGIGLVAIGLILLTPATAAPHSP